MDRYNALLDELTTIMTDIHYSYTSNEAPKQLGVPAAIMRKINAEIKTSTTTTLPSMESLFADAQDNVERYHLTRAQKPQCISDVIVLTPVDHKHFEVCCVSALCETV